jgi:hypothetical protein
VAGLELRHVRQQVGGVVGLARVDRLDRDERGQRQLDRVVVDDRRVSLDHAALLEPPHALVHRRRREAGLLAEIGVRHPPVAREQPQDLPVELLHARHPLTRPAP